MSGYAPPRNSIRQTSSALSNKSVPDVFIPEILARVAMNIFYIIGVIVVVIAILSFLGLR